MSAVINIDSHHWDTPYTNKHPMEAAHIIEQGNVLLLPTLHFDLLPHEEKFLSPHYSNSHSKNISYHPKTDTLSGMVCTHDEYPLLKKMLHRYSQSSLSLVQKLLNHYSHALQIGRTSYRPIEIADRVTPSYRKDDTRLHVDAFPSAPNQGARILRVFSNINPNGKPRIWRIGEPFFKVAQQFLPRIHRPWPWQSTLLKLLKITKSYRTEYDHIMLHIHDAMKANTTYQKKASQLEVPFKAGASWIVQTDDVSHAAMSGQYVLEQTFYLPVTAMLNPSLSPLRILEQLTGRKLSPFF